MKSLPIKNIFLLLTTAIIWGVAFVAQQVGMDYIGPLAFNAIRCIMGFIVIAPVVWFLDKKKSAFAKANENKKLTLKAGVICGAVLAVAMMFQQFGMKYTTAGKAGFITALYIVIVPILGMAFGKKVGIKIWASVGISIVGLYLLCMKTGFSLDLGDSLVFACAFAFSVHILVIDHFAGKVDGVKMACIQFLVAALVSAIAMVLFENIPTWEMLWAVRVPLLYTGIMSSGVAFTLQIVGQKGVNPTVASLILSLEAVISAVAAWLILQQGMTEREMLGGGLMFFAIILAQLPDRKGREKALQE